MKLRFSRDFEYALDGIRVSVLRAGTEIETADADLIRISLAEKAASEVKASDPVTEVRVGAKPSEARKADPAPAANVEPAKVEPAPAKVEPPKAEAKPAPKVSP